MMTDLADTSEDGHVWCEDLATCLNCLCSWMAIYTKGTGHKLECPMCHAQNSTIEINHDRPV